VLCIRTRCGIASHLVLLRLELLLAHLLVNPVHATPAALPRLLLLVGILTRGAVRVLLLVRVELLLLLLVGVVPLLLLLVGVVLLLLLWHPLLLLGPAPLRLLPPRALLWPAP